jgi:signal transduction histidine kinase
MLPMISKEVSPKNVELASTGNDKLAHDIRASLHIIIGNAELMMDDIGGKISAEQRLNLQTVLTHSARLLEISEEIIRRLDLVSKNEK